MTTIQSWIEATRRVLMTGRQEQRNVLASPYTPGSGSLTFTASPAGVVVGARLSVGLNVFHVLSVSQSTLTATVVGGQEGSTDVAASAGDLVKVGPRFTDFDIYDALGNELRDLSAPDQGLFQMLSAEVTYLSSGTGYDLALPGLIDVYQVRAAEHGTAKAWNLIDKALWRFDRSADLVDFPSGTALMIFGQAYNGLAVRVLYRSEFTLPPEVPNAAWDVSLSGLATSAYDIPPLGAAMRLVYPREVKRNFTEAQGDTRRAGEVQAGAVAGSASAVAALRKARVAAEAARLTARYPDRRYR